MPGLVAKYVDTSGSYPYAAVNAFNWFAALGGNWAAQDGAVLGPVTWEMLGIAHIVLLTAALAAAGWLALRRGRFSPVLLAAAYLAGVFTFAHNMHERYLIPAVVLTLWAAARWDDRRLLGAAAGMTLTGFVNLCAVLCAGGYRRCLADQRRQRHHHPARPAWPRPPSACCCSMRCTTLRCTAAPSRWPPPAARQGRPRPAAQTPCRPKALPAGPPR